MYSALSVNEQARALPGGRETYYNHWVVRKFIMV